MRRFVRPALLVAALALLVVIAGAARADAHALLERSDPPAYRLLLRPPDRIILRFTEAVDNRATEIKVLDQEGRRVDRQRFQLSDDRRQATLPVQFPGPGIYTVAWRTLSLVDQHTYEGFFTLTVGPLRPGGFTLRGGVPAGPLPWDVAVRWLMLLGAAALVGGTLAHRILVPAAISQAPGIDAHVASGILHRLWRGVAWLGAADARVRYTFRPLIENLGTAIAEAEPQGDGRFVLRGAYISTRGPWMITLTLRRRGSEDTTFLYFVERDWEGGTPISPPTDPRAFALLRQADATMNGLRSMRQHQDLTDGRSGHVVVFSEFAAPDAFHYKVIGGLESIIVGDGRFINEGGGWRKLSDVPFTFPNFTFAQNADHVVFGAGELVDDTPVQPVVFILKSAGASARYIVWIDEKSRRILREAMIAPGHYMLSRNYAFDAPVKILAPPSR